MRLCSSAKARWPPLQRCWHAAAASRATLAAVTQQAAGGPPGALKGTAWSNTRHKICSKHTVAPTAPAQNALSCICIYQYACLCPRKPAKRPLFIYDIHQSVRKTAHTPVGEESNCCIAGTRLVAATCSSYISAFLPRPQLMRLHAFLQCMLVCCACPAVHCMEVNTGPA